MLELDHKGTGHFLTLTYSPDEDEASYADVQRFFKRVRRNNPDWDLSFIARGETGENFGRWHWHVLAFGWREIFPDGISYLDEWPFGHVHFGELNSSTAAYLYAYTMKGDDWGETRYSSKPSVGFAGMMQLAETLASRTQYAICPNEFSFDGVKYPISYYMRGVIEARMQELGCVEVPGLSDEHLRAMVAEYRSKVQSGAYDRVNTFVKFQARKPKGLTHGQIERLRTFKPIRPRYQD